MGVKLLTEHHLEFLSLPGGCTGSSESTLVKIPHCWKSRVAAIFAFHHSSELLGLCINKHDHYHQLEYDTDTDHQIDKKKQPRDYPVSKSVVLRLEFGDIAVTQIYTIHGIVTGILQRCNYQVSKLKHSS